MQELLIISALFATMKHSLSFTQRYPGLRRIRGEGRGGEGRGKGEGRREKGTVDYGSRRREDILDHKRRKES